MRLLTFPSIAGFAAISPALAQISSPPDSYSIAFRAANSHEQTTRIVSGEFNSDGVLDFAMLQGQQVSVAFDPGFVEASAVLPDLYRDIASHSRTGHAERADLIGVGSAGLQRGAWNHATNGFQMDEAIDTAAYPLLHAAWIGATKVRSGQINGDSVPDLVGIGSDMKTLLLAMGSDGGFVPPASGFPVVEAAGVVLDLTVLDHDGDGLGELLVLSEWGLEVFDTDLTLLHSFQVSSTEGHVETVRSQGSAEERAAWLRTLPSGDRHLWIIDGQPFGVNQIIDVTSLMASAITSGRFDGNASSDIAITDSTGAAIRILKQRVDGTFAINGADMSTVVIDNLPATDLMTPTAFGDIDADGDLDVLAARSRANMIFIGRNQTVNHREFAPRFLPLANQDGPQLWESEQNGSPILNIRFEAPYGPGATSPESEYTHSHPDGATHLQVSVWRTNETTPGQYETEHTSLETIVIPLVEDSTEFYDGVRFLHARPGYFDGWSSTQGIQFVTTRYVTLDASLTPVKVFAHNSLFFTDQDNQPALIFLFGLPFVSGNYEVFDEDPWNLQLEPSGRPGGPQSDESHSGNGSTNCIPTVPPENVPISVPPQEETTTPPAMPPGN